MHINPDPTEMLVARRAACEDLAKAIWHADNTDEKLWPWDTLKQYERDSYYALADYLLNRYDITPKQPDPTELEPNEGWAKWRNQES